MPQSTAALRLKDRALRTLRHPQCLVPSHLPAQPVLVRTVWAKAPQSTSHGLCLALELREADQLFVLVRTATGEEAWAPALRILNPDERRRWAQEGFG